jgi:hypothetical protein
MDDEDELDTIRARLVDRRSDCWARLEDAICELVALHDVRAPELLARVQAMHEQERAQAESTLRGVPPRAPV